MPDEILTRKEVQAMLKVGKSTIQKLEKQGVLKPFTVTSTAINAHKRYHKTDIDKLIK